MKKKNIFLIIILSFETIIFLLIMYMIYINKTKHKTGLNYNIYHLGLAHRKNPYCRYYKKCYRLSKGNKLIVQLKSSNEETINLIEQFLKGNKK